MFTNNRKHIQICVSFVYSVIYHDFRDQRIFHPLFGLKSQIMTLSQKFQKSDFFGHCSFTQLFHDVEKLRRKPKIFVKVIQRFWCVQHVGLMFLKKIHQKQPNLQTKKTLLFLSSRFLDQIFLLPLICWCLPRWRTHGSKHVC